MTQVEAANWQFPSGLGIAICALAERIEILAERLGSALEAWEEDGLGPTVGFALKLSDTSVFLVKEFGTDHPHFHGPVVEVDAGEGARRGFDDLMADVATALRLGPGAISWRPADTSEWQENAKGLVQLAERVRSRGP